MIDRGAASTVSARTQLRGDVIEAGRILTPYWPIDTFIAVNPLGGWEHLPFDTAVHSAGTLLGARGTLTDTQFRAAHRCGRITEDDLAAAITHYCPQVAEHPGVPVDGTVLSAVDILGADLLYGTPEPAPARTLHTRSELLAPRIAAAVNAHTTTWCAAFFAAEHTPWPMPRTERGLYPAWRDLAWRDRGLPAGARQRLRQLPDLPDDTALGALESLGITRADRVTYLQAHLASMPGWASHIRWHAENTSAANLTDYLAIRLAYETELLRAARLLDQPAAPAALPRSDPSPTQRSVLVAARLTGGNTQIAAIGDVLGLLPAAARRLVWQHAYEAGYRTTLLRQLTDQPSAPPAGRPAAQIVCCIDTRSEELRRHLEAVGPYETFGFAGFFAVAIRYRELTSAAASAQCPVLLTARNDVTEHPTGAAGHTAVRAMTGRRDLAAGEDAFHAAKNDTLAPFTLAEAAGWIAGPLAAAKTLAPRWHHQLRLRLQRWIAPPVPTVLTIEDGFTAEERYLFAEAALTMMGLTATFAPLIVLSGHGSTTENNPFEAALHCGACGGHRGAPNARTAAAILNDAAVRAHLAGQGIHIPPDSWFVAAEHDTAHDTVTLLDAHLVPASHHDPLERLTADLAEAGTRACVGRRPTLPGAPRSARAGRVVRHVRARSADWAQVYPEWGLAGNACFIVGPRTMTAGINLHRRAFLHSYDGAVDPNGVALETILTAPLVVAQWINHQYYFSTVAPEVFGAGTKTIHNVVGTTGVLAGHTGDLQLGLPWQSVAVGEHLVHEPLRLLAIVQAPLARIDAIVDRNPILQHLFGNHWITLTAREHPHDPWQLHTPHGWQPSPDPKAPTS